MGVTFNTDTGIEEYFVGSKKILTHKIKTGEIEYHDLPVKHAEIYAAFSSTEYGKITKCLGYFSDKVDADKAAEGQGYYGSNGIVLLRHTIEINNHGHKSVYVLREKDPIDLDNQKANADEILRKKTMDSLTSEQKRVLGL